jgi:Rad3-related DNA helicase
MISRRKGENRRCQEQGFQVIVGPRRSVDLSEASRSGGRIDLEWREVGRAFKETSTRASKVELVGIALYSGISPPWTSLFSSLVTFRGNQNSFCMADTPQQVSKEKKGKIVDARCRDLTSAFACEKGRADPGSVELCSFHEELNNYEAGNLLPTGIFTLEDVKRYGKEKGVCPYFTIRRMVCLVFSVGNQANDAAQLPHVDVIIYSFHYLLDPKIADQVSKEMSKESIVVFDEAHNIGLSYPFVVFSRLNPAQITSALNPFRST